MQQHASESNILPSTRGLCYVALFALVIRVAYWSEHVRSAFFAVPLLDERYYDLVAQTLAAGGDLTVFGGFRPLLYSAFMSLGYLLAGPELARPLVLFTQHGLGVLTTVFVTLTAARAARSPRAGLAAGGVFALASPPLFFEGEMLLTTLLTFVLSGSILAMAMARDPDRRGAWRYWALSGTLAAVGVQAWPNVLVWFVAMAAAAGIAAVAGRRALATACCIWVTAAILALLPFGFANALQTGRYQVLTAAGGINFYLGNRGGADGMTPVQDRSVSYAGPYDDPVRVYAEQEYQRIHPSAPPRPDPAAVSRYWQQSGINEIRAAPGDWLRLMLRKTGYMLWNREIANNKTFSFTLRHESRLLRCLPVRWWLLAGLAPIGAVVIWRRGDRVLLLLLAALSGSFGAGIVLFFVNGRFRIPLWPPMCVLAGAALAHGWRADYGGHRIRILTHGLAGLMLAGTFLGGVGVPPESYARDFFFRSKARLIKGDAAGAASDIAESLRLDENNPDALFQLASVRFVNGDLAGSRSVLTNYTRRWPDDPQAWSNLGVVCHRLNRNLEAYEACSRALERDPRNANAVLTRAMLLVRAGQLPEALQVLNRAQGADDRADGLATRSALARRMGSTEQAEGYAAQARNVDATLTEDILTLLATPLTEAEKAHVMASH
jgi:Flp pilus assembly protein TadD